LRSVTLAQIERRHRDSGGPNQRDDQSNGRLDVAHKYLAKLQKDRATAVMRALAIRAFYKNKQELVDTIRRIKGEVPDRDEPEQELLPPVQQEQQERPTLILDPVQAVIGPLVNVFGRPLFEDD
jgi:hypothetical protein